MKKLLVIGALVLGGCMTESEEVAPPIPVWPQNKKEVSGNACTSTIYLDVGPQPERWEVYGLNETSPGDTIYYPVDVPWVSGKGISLPCDARVLKWTVFY